jgi:hypothetical protein
LLCLLFFNLLLFFVCSSFPALLVRCSVCLACARACSPACAVRVFFCVCALGVRVCQLLPLCRDDLVAVAKKSPLRAKLPGLYLVVKVSSVLHLIQVTRTCTKTARRSPQQTPPMRAQLNPLVCSVQGGV